MESGKWKESAFKPLGGQSVREDDDDEHSLQIRDRRGRKSREII